MDYLLKVFDFYRWYVVLIFLDERLLFIGTNTGNKLNIAFNCKIYVFSKQLKGKLISHIRRFKYYEIKLNFTSVSILKLLFPVSSVYLRAASIKSVSLSSS